MYEPKKYAVSLSLIVLFTLFLFLIDSQLETAMSQQTSSSHHQFTVDSGFSGSVGYCGFYWSSSLSTYSSSYADYLVSVSYDIYIDYYYRYNGRSVRPVLRE